MSVYNRKSWIHNGTKHWIHNGKHYRKKLGFFGTKRKFKRKYIEKRRLDKYTHTWEGKTDDDFLNEIYQANEDFEHDLDIDSKIAELDGYY